MPPFSCFFVQYWTWSLLQEDGLNFFFCCFLFFIQNRNQAINGALRRWPVLKERDLALCTHERKLCVCMCKSERFDWLVPPPACEGVDLANLGDGLKIRRSASARSVCRESFLQSLKGIKNNVMVVKSHSKPTECWLFQNQIVATFIPLNSLGQVTSYSIIMGVRYRSKWSHLQEVTCKEHLLNWEWMNGFQSENILYRCLCISWHYWLTSCWHETFSHWCQRKAWLIS